MNLYSTLGTLNPAIHSTHKTTFWTIYTKFHTFCKAHLKQSMKAFPSKFLKKFPTVFVWIKLLYIVPYSCNNCWVSYNYIRLKFQTTVSIYSRLYVFVWEKVKFLLGIFHFSRFPANFILCKFFLQILPHPSYTYIRPCIFFLLFFFAFLHFVVALGHGLYVVLVILWHCGFEPKITFKFKDFKSSAMTVKYENFHKFHTRVAPMADVSAFSKKDSISHLPSTMVGILAKSKMLIYLPTNAVNLLNMEIRYFQILQTNKMVVKMIYE